MIDKEEVIEMKKDIENLQEQSFAFELLKDQRKQNKRLFIILIVVLCMWFTTGCYLVYTLNDIETITDEQTIDNVGTIENSTIDNG